MSEARFPETGLLANGGTFCVVAADKDGMLVSFMQSNARGFGSGIVVPKTGITLQSRAQTFTDKVGHPNE